MVLIMSENTPLVSINIPTYNSERTIKKCLESVKSQTYSNIEVIVIDSYSYDQTVKIAKRYGAKVLFERGLPSQRMLGIKKSKGEYILLLDSDQVLEFEAVETCVRKCQEDFDALVLREKSIHNEKNIISRILAYNMQIVQQDLDVYYGTALPRFFRASMLKIINSIPSDIGYFDHAFIYHEILRLGAKVNYVDAYIYHYEVDSTVKFLKKFYNYYGKCIIPALKYNKKLVLGRSAPKRVYFSRDLIRKPLLLICLNILYLVKAVATLAGVISYTLNTFLKDKATKNGRNS